MMTYRYEDNTKKKRKTKIIKNLKIFLKRSSNRRVVIVPRRKREISIKKLNIQELRIKNKEILQKNLVGILIISEMEKKTEHKWRTNK